MINNLTLNQTLRDELYAWNKIFVKNHINCREELFDTFHTLQKDNPSPGVEVWLAAVQEIEKYFVFTESQRKMFLIVAEYY